MRTREDSKLSNRDLEGPEIESKFKFQIFKNPVADDQSSSRRQFLDLIHPEASQAPRLQEKDFKSFRIRLVTGVRPFN